MGGRRVKIVALGAVIGLAVAGTAVAQSSSIDRKDNKDRAVLVKAAYLGGDVPLRYGAFKQASRPAAETKPAPYIYKAPMATRPIKTW